MYSQLVVNTAYLVCIHGTVLSKPFHSLYISLAVQIASDKSSYERPFVLVLKISLD